MLAKFGRLALINSIAVWSTIAAGIDLGLAFGWFTWTMSQVAVVHAFYIAVVMMFRQFFSLTGDNVQDSPVLVTHYAPDPVPLAAVTTDEHVQGFTKA